MTKSFPGGEVATTMAGDGYPRRAFTADEIWRMQDLGILDDDEGFELIEGDIVMMQSKNAPHERIKLALNRALSKTLPDTLQLGIETSLVLGTHTIVDPDLSVFPMMDSTSARGPDVLLAIEVATTTLRKDLKLKAALYARYGVQEYWVIDTTKLRTTVHRAPVDGVWSSVEVLPAEAVLTHKSASGFAVTLAKL
jgi:Uma2 family endonuclease